MSDQPREQSSETRTPSYDVYDAPTHGDVAPDATAPTRLTPPIAAPQTTDPYAAPPLPDQQWGPYPARYQVPSQYLVNPNAPTHSLATASLVLGAIGLASAMLAPILYVTIVGVVCSPFAIWLGARSGREIKANPQAWRGAGVATAGLVTGIIGLVLGLLMLLLVLALVVLFASVIAGLG